MLLLIHIVISVISLVYSINTAINPNSKRVLNIYKFITATVLSGVLLVATNPNTIGKFCISGTVYLILTALLVKISKARIPKTLSI